MSNYTSTKIYPNSASLQKPFFFNKAVYAVSQIGNEIATAKFKLNASGAAEDFKMFEARTAVARCWNSLATCVYRGKPYLFFDSAKESDRWRYDLRYKIASSPDDGWLPADANGNATGLSCSYENWGIWGTPPTLGAAVCDDKIFLFYYRDNAIYYATFDGTTFREIGPLFSQNYEPNFSVATATRKGEPVMVFAGVKQGDNRHMHLSIIDRAGTVLSTHGIYLDWAQYNNMFGIGHGSIVEAESDVVQLFANNSGDKLKGLRRAWFNLNDPGHSAWFDTGIISNASPYAFCDVAIAAVPDGNAGNFRQHLVLITNYPDAKIPGGDGFVPDPHQIVTAYSSDYFRCEHEGVADTKDGATEEPDAWTLLGVVEGVPPFTRNGMKPTEMTSNVLYGESKAQKVTVTQGYETALSGSAGLGIDKVFSISAELTTTFGTTNELSRTITQSIDVTMANQDRNKDGSRGWLLVAKPQLLGRRYSRLTQDLTSNLGQYYVVAVKNVSVGIEDYKLEVPRKGMLVRKPSTDLAYWKNVEIPPHPSIVDYDINALTATLTGGTVKSSLKITDAEKRTTKAAVKIAIKGKGTIKKVLNLEGSAGFNYTTGLEVVSEFSQNISASLRLLDPKVEETIVTKLVVTPVWLVAKSGATLDPSKRPYWVTEEFAANGVIPWCLTWRVNEIRYEMRSEVLPEKALPELVEK